MKYLLFKPSLLLTLSLCTAISCTTANGSTAKNKVPNHSGVSQMAPTAQKQLAASSTAANSSEPAKVQPQYQNDFARELAKSGPQSEGWALFSDSSMGHNGQRWIIKEGEGKNKKVTLCIILQQDKECKKTTLTEKQFTDLIPTLKAGEKLSHILPTAYDALSFEFLHARNSSPQTERVVFISSSKPFPAEYEALIKAFN